MLAILNFLIAHNLPIFQPILMILVSKFMVHRALSDKTYLLLGLLSPLRSDDFRRFYSNLLTFCAGDRVKSGIFGQTAKFGQRPCLFHISNME